MQKSGGHRPRRILRVLVGSAALAVAAVPMISVLPANAASPNVIVGHPTNQVFHGPNGPTECVAAGRAMLSADIVGFSCRPDPQDGPDAVRLWINFDNF